MVALFPSPDNVVPVGEVAGKKLDGCFIGACTTAEEDLILAALVLDSGLKKGWTPSKTGIRKVITEEERKGRGNVDEGGN
jgi:homoaconitase/3-isopropylmalate dehydratase large subunit